MHFMLYIYGSAPERVKRHTLRVRLTDGLYVVWYKYTRAW